MNNPTQISFSQMKTLAGIMLPSDIVLVETRGPSGALDFILQSPERGRPFTWTSRLEGTIDEDGFVTLNS